jgi:enamine deaminase RidA (YjgF/YER057c/UK114 family)
MDGPMTSASRSPHALINPPELGPAVGFTHVVAAFPGRLVHVAGQIASTADGVVLGESLAEQFDVALANVVTALAAAGCRPDHTVSMLVFTTSMEEYRESRRAIGAAWRSHFGRHFPAVALVGVNALYVEAAKVEVVTWAVVPD